MPALIFLDIGAKVVVIAEGAEASDAVAVTIEDTSPNQQGHNDFEAPDTEAGHGL